MKNNLILIGMAGCGKSTLGVLLAKKLGLGFLDTDLVIQNRERRLLQTILDEDGLEAFTRAEENALLGVDVSDTVIATGGSAVLSEAAMTHLKASGMTVWLSLPYAVIRRRITNLATRGIAMKPGQTLRDVYDEREPLYERYADLRIDCRGTPEANVRAVLEALSGRSGGSPE